MKTPDDYAREFKLPHCVGNKNFAKQIRKIQKEAYERGFYDGPLTRKKTLKYLES